jgi:hypothetical protein
MPARNGKWVSWATIEAEKKAQQVVVDTAEPEADTEADPAAKKSRRSPKAAEAAIAEATGVQLTIDDIAEAKAEALFLQPITPKGII